MYTLTTSITVDKDTFTKKNLCKYIICMLINSLLDSTKESISPSYSRSRQWHHKFAHHREQRQQSDDRQKRDREPNSGVQSISPTHWNVDGSSALLKPCHQGEGQRLHYTRKKKKKTWFLSAHTCFHYGQWIICINGFYLQWGKEPRHTALLSIVTRNMWQFLKSDSILSIDSIL